MDGAYLSGGLGHYTATNQLGAEFVSDFPPRGSLPNTMTSENNLFQNSLFLYGQAVMTMAIIVAVALFVVEDATVRNVLLLIAVVELVVTPQVLKRVGEQQAASE